MRVSAEDIAFGRWADLLHSAGLSETYLSKRHGPCPLCGGKDRYRFIDKTGKGDYYCNNLGTCGPGDGFKLLMGLLGMNFQGAAQWIRDHLVGVKPLPRLHPVAAPTVDQLTPEEVAKRVERHRRLWAEARPVQKNDPVHRYLAARVPGLTQIPKVIRFHPSLPYWETNEHGKVVCTGKHPAMIAAVQGPDGRVCNLHRTYLTWKGTKAAVETVRKLGLFVHSNSGAIRLCEPGEVLSLAEGIETASSVNVLTGEMCWPVLSTSGMRNFVLPAGYERVKSVRIYADNDGVKKSGNRPGLDAARALAAKLSSTGIKTLVLAPSRTGEDFNDLLLNLHQKQLRVA